MRNRQDEIVRTGYLGIATNVVVSVGKAFVGILAGSMAIVLDAVNNLTDALSSVITIIGVKLAGRPADDKHPFGYGRIEYMTAVIIAAMVLLAGSMSLIESVKGILEPSEQDYSAVGLGILVVTLIVKFFLGVYTKRKGQELSSDSLVSSGTECIFDCIVSISTLVSAALTIFFDWNVDSWLAAIISCLIIKAGVEMLMAPIRELLGMRSDPQLIASIKKCVNGIDGVRGTYDVIIHNYGPEQNIGALHVEVDENTTAADIHHLTKLIQVAVHKEFDIFVTVGFYAHHQKGTDAAKEEATVRQYVMAIDGVRGMHGFYVDHKDRVLSFDIVYSYEIKQPISLRQNVKEWLENTYTDYNIIIGLDRVF